MCVAGASSVKNLYAIYGALNLPLSLPRSYHVPSPFGSDIGGTSPEFHSIQPETEYDSWLTVGVTDGNNFASISSLGIDMRSWDQGAISAENGAVFWMDPDRSTCTMRDGPCIVGQLTVASDTPAVVTMNAQGRSFEHDWEEHSQGAIDWEQLGLKFTLIPDGVPPASNSDGVGDCTPFEMAALLAAAQNSCCAEDKCINGPPSICSASCQVEMQVFWSACRSTAENILDDNALLDFALQCAAAHTREQHAVSYKPTVSVASECSYHQLIGTSLDCAQTSPNDYCGSPCQRSLVPFSRRCSDSMGRMFTLFGLDELAETDCAENEDPTTCPIEHLRNMCTSFASTPNFGLSTHNSASVCSSACIRSLTVHLDSCLASVDPNVATAFPRSTWAPVIRYCEESEAGIIQHAGDELASRCETIRQVMESELAGLCCDQGNCSPMPSTCSVQCAEAFNPWFKSCADEFLQMQSTERDDFIHLATMCSAVGPEGHNQRVPLVGRLNSSITSEQTDLTPGH